MSGRADQTNRTADARRVGVLVVDDHAELRWVICEVVAATARMVVTGQAGSGEAAIDAADRLKPQLVIMDVHMPGIGGVEATRRLTRGQPGVVVLLVSVDEMDPDAVRSCGATAFLRKQRLCPAMLCRAWRARTAPSQ